MHILLLAATSFEIQSVIDFLSTHKGQISVHSVRPVIAGVGMVHTTYGLMAAISQQRPDLIIQAGIGGSFSANYLPGSIVVVERDTAGDLGVEEQAVFKDVFDMGFQQPDVFPYTNKWLVNAAAASLAGRSLPLVTGITVNEVTTSASRIEQLKEKYQPVVESMEGAAMHYVALQESIPFIQLRGISNMVGERNKGNWRIKEAIGVLNEAVLAWLKQTS